MRTYLVSAIWAAALTLSTSACTDGSDRADAAAPPVSSPVSSGAGSPVSSPASDSIAGQASRGATVTSIALPGADTFPEGIVATSSGELFVSGFGNGSILRVSPSGVASTFKAAGQDGLSSSVGMAVDEARHRLWVANFDFATFASELVVFNLDDGAVVGRLAAGRSPSFFNEVALDPSGRVYVTDTLAPVIWTAGPELDGVELFVEDQLLDNPDPDQVFGLNGLALVPQGTALIASVMDRIDQGGGRLVRIDLRTRAVSEVRLFGFGDVVASFGGSDGMFFDPSGRLFMVNVTPPAAIITARFTPDYAAAWLVERDAFEGSYNRPTSSALLGGRLWTVNSQLDHIIDDENGALGTPPDLPFQLVGVPLGRLLWSF